ncbi:MAG: gamma-glutamyl-gamma-aminobutyrate hydrolase family protein, partial [Prevotella sp.]|nr:gamma-glutamyl-gamma-aminobutyrate hydrolase family protein [Prevotella sp.]
MNKKFDLQAQLEDIYAQFPEASPKPVIGITGNYEDLTCKIGRGYYQSVVEAGGVPVIIPPVADHHVIINTLQRIDGLILSGGGDYNPLWAGEEPSPLLHGINQERDNAELLITRLAYNRQIPILGICRGIQTLAMALGGKVAQDLSEVKSEGVKSEKFKAVKHSQDADRSEPTHSVTIEPDSILSGIYKSYSSKFKFQISKLFVNSFHHQAVSDAG